MDPGPRLGLGWVRGRIFITINPFQGRGRETGGERFWCMAASDGCEGYDGARMKRIFLRIQQTLCLFSQVFNFSPENHTVGLFECYRSFCHGDFQPSAGRKGGGSNN